MSDGPLFYTEDHDTGDADLSSVRCQCRLWCGWPTCIECQEDHGSNWDGRCRDCNIEHGLDRMHCTGCGRMRYRTETPLGNIGAYLWGEPCTCPEPRPQTRADVRAS